MQQLRLVAPSDDGTYLTVLSDATGEYFALPIDDALRIALRPTHSDRLPRPMTLDGQAPPSAALTPREIQVRVRAGELPEDLAVEAGVSTDRIGRFATAVLQERSRVAAEARRARARRGGADGELVPFGEAVDDRFLTHGIDPGLVLWDAVRDADGPWTIKAAWTIGEVSGSASWTFELGPRLMTPDDETAAELLSDRPVPPRASLSAPPEHAAAQETAPASRSTGNVRQLPSRQDDGFFDQEAVEAPADADPMAPVTELASFFAPAPAPAAPAEHDPAPQDYAPADPNAPTDQIPRIEAEPAAAGQPAQSSETQAPSDDGLFPAPGPAVGLDELVPETLDLTGVQDDDSAERRARIPSWDDILLGVRRKRD